MKKKLSSLMISLFVFASCIGQPTWQKLNSPVTESLISLCFIDNMHGWILSDEGTILKTTDGGTTWQTSSIDGGRFTSIYFTNQNHGCITAYQDSSLIFLTTDGGDTWQQIYHAKAERLNDVFFADDAKGWAVGIAENMNYNLYTSDGGLTWSPQMDIFVMEAELNSVSFRNENIGSTCGADGNFFITNSGGTTGWAMDISIPSLGIDLNGLFNWGELKGCAVGASGTALVTINTWAQYIETVTNTTEDLNAVSADIVTGNLWAVGDNGTIIYTPNYLLGWGSQNSGVETDLNDVQMLAENNGWCVGNDGTLLHFTDGSSIDEQSSPIYRVFPNPTMRMVYIEINKPQQSIQFSLLDVTGKVLMHHDVKDTELQFECDVSAFPPGIYFLRISSDNGTYTKKIHRL